MSSCKHLTCLHWSGDTLAMDELKEKLRIAANSATINSSDQKEIAERIAKIFNEEKSSSVNAEEQCKYLEGNSSQSKEELFKDLHACIKGITECIKHCGSMLHKCTDNKETSINDTLLLSRSVMAKIKMILSHCKESSKIYGGYFPEISSDLSMLFKTSYQTQKVILEILEKMKISESMEEEQRSSFASVVTELLNVVLVLKDIDLMALINTLRSMNRIILDKKNLIHDKLDVELLFSTICTCLVEKLNYCWSLINGAATHKQNDDTKCNKVIKVLRFQAGMLLQLIKEYSSDMNGKAIESVIQVLILLQSMQPISSSAPLKGFALYEDFCSSVLSVLEPILVELMGERSFVWAVRSLKVRKELCEKEQNLSTLLILQNLILNLAKATESTCEAWMKEIDSFSTRPSILDLIFQFFEQCTKESFGDLLISSCVGTGKPMRDVTLYEFTCAQISAFISTAPPPVFPIVESCLIRNLLFSSPSWLLAADVLNFTARWGPDALSYDLASFFAELICAISKVSNGKNGTFNRCLEALRRIFNLLSGLNKQKFFSSFHPSKSEFLPVWLSIDLDSFESSLREKFYKIFFTTTLKSLEECKEKGNIRAMITTLKAWKNCLKVDGCLELVPSVQRCAILDVLMEVFKAFKSNQCEEIDQDFFCLVLNSISKMIKYMQEKYIQEVLEVTDRILELNTSELLQLSCCSLLSASKSCQFSSDFEESCLNCLWSSFSRLLSSKSFFVRLEAMKSLKEFTEVTKYTDAIYNYFSGSMSENFLKFLSQEILLQNYTSKDKESRLLQVLSFADDVADQSVLAVINNVPSPVYESHQEPATKRARTEVISEQKLLEGNKAPRIEDEKIDAAIKEIRDSLRNSQTSETAKTKLKRLAKDILELLPDES